MKRPQLSPKQQAILRFVLAVLITAIAMLGLWFVQRYDIIGEVGYAGVFAMGFLANATILLPAPSWAVTIFAGTTLHPFFVALAAGMGESLGEITGYLAGSSGSIVLEDRESYQKSARLMKRWGVWFILGLAFIPNPAFDIVGIIAGALRMPVVKFLWGAFLGKFIRALLLAYGGYGVFNHFWGG
ncbi:MAG TPA: DedA family protein [Anaerolineae bacterium]|nr:VTT domain-containing protein [Caldilineae bacterium]HID35025.1 DedA family protein [Anaerolineae bacterium]